MQGRPLNSCTCGGKPKEMQQGDLTLSIPPGRDHRFPEKRIERAADDGIDPAQIMVDPGLGFGKTVTDNMRLIRYLGEFKSVGEADRRGPSRKAFIGQVTGGTPRERIEGTAAVVTAAILNGGNVIRVHDVSIMKKVAVMADAVSRA